MRTIYFYRTGTEEQKTIRADLLAEIIAIIEREEAAINNLRGPSDDTQPVEGDMRQANAQRMNERAAAEQERDAVLQEACK